MKKHFYSLTKAECFGSSTFQKIQKSIETPTVPEKNPRRTKKRTCKSLEQAENHEKGLCGSWARNHMGNPD